MKTARAPGKTDLEAQISKLEDQQFVPQFATFSNDDSWAMRSLLVTLGNSRSLPIAIDIRRNGHQLFHAALAGTSPNNDAWIEPKITLVNRFGEISFSVGRRLALTGGMLDESNGLEPILHVTHDGSFPVIVRGVGPVGIITVSGLPQADDHALVVEALQSLLHPTDPPAPSP